MSRTNRIASFLLPLGLLVHLPAADALQIAGFAANLPGGEEDDAVWIHNPGTDPVSLTDVYLSDNTGRIRFPVGTTLDPGTTIVAAGNASSFYEATGTWPDYAMGGLAAERTLRSTKNGFGLAQDGDRILLERSSDLVDVVSYGTDRYAGPAWSGGTVNVGGPSFLRWFPRVGAADTDMAKDWESPRAFVLGQHDWPVSTHTIRDPLVGYVAPDHARAVVESIVASATNHLRINVYQFRDLALRDAILETMSKRPGLRVDVLLDQRPVGESADEMSERGHVIEGLSRAGANVRILRHERYAYDHAKYVVVDQRIVLVQSENFVRSGIPMDHASGNRGWGVVLESVDLATRLAQAFDDDFEISDHGARLPTADDAPDFPPPVEGAVRRAPVTQPVRSNVDAKAHLIIAPLDPQGPDPIRDAIRTARDRVQIAQLNFPPLWRDVSGRDWPHPYVEAVKEAAARGVRVEVLLDGHFLDESSAADNADTYDLLDPDPNVEVRLVPDDAPVLHAKGLVVDRRHVLVGSMNWNRNSMLQNREVSVLIEEPQLGAFFSDVFDHDWAASDPRPPGIASTGALATLLILVGLGGRPWRSRS